MSLRFICGPFLPPAKRLMPLARINSRDFPSFSAKAVGSGAGGMPVSGERGAVPGWDLGGCPSAAEQLMGTRL